MEELIKILEKFENNKKNWKGTWNENAVAECFKPCAKDLLCNGYFLVNNEYIIDLGAIELYYHEEKGDIKDHIMYHTNERPNKYGITKDEWPYFKFGSFNLHQSGVDVTFENLDEKYRASFLIRSYRILKAEDGKYPQNDTTKYDPHSTHIFDDMFYSGLLMSDIILSNKKRVERTTIKWVLGDKKVDSIIQCPRINVALYRPDGNKYVKIKKKDYLDNKKIMEENYPELKIAEPHYFKSGSNEYLRDTRLWRFRIKGIQEIGINEELKQCQNCNLCENYSHKSV